MTWQGKTYALAVRWSHVLLRGSHQLFQLLDPWTRDGLGGDEPPLLPATLWLLAYCYVFPFRLAAALLPLALLVDLWGLLLAVWVYGTLLCSPYYLARRLLRRGRLSFRGSTAGALT